MHRAAPASDACDVRRTAERMANRIQAAIDRMYAAADALEGHG